jgi:hypothetical protein
MAEVCQTEAALRGALMPRTGRLAIQPPDGRELTLHGIRPFGVDA